MTKRALQKEQTSKAILSASLSVFAELGYNTATFSDISKIAKVTNGLIVQRFGSKEALYLQLLNGIIADFPAFEACNEVTDGLVKVIAFIKAVGARSIEELSFCNTAFVSVTNLPDSCKNAIHALFDNTKLNRIFVDEIELGKIKNNNPFDVFARFIQNCCDLTIQYCKAGEEFPADDVYLQLFKKLDAIDEAKYGLVNEATVFDSISEKSLKLYNVTTWYAEISEDREPALYFPKTILRKAGVEDDATPEFVYKFIVEHVDADDVPIVRDAIHRMYLGQYVEFEYRWSAPAMKTTYYRCSGKRTNVENGVTRFEGILQNISSFKTLRNRNKTRNFFLNLIAQDYEYVSYVHLGATGDDDIVEDFKASEFLNKLTDNWEHNNNFVDRFNIVINKVLTGVDRERFVKVDNRAVILNALKKSDRYTTSFKIRHFGVAYHYEVVFFPDREDDGTIKGLVCGIRLVNNISSKLRGNVETDENKEKQISDMLLNNHEAGFLVNLKDHTFEICREDSHFSRRNSYIPDFEAFIQSYIKRDVYFEDIKKMIEATSLLNVRTQLDSAESYTINYRDISRGTPHYYVMRFSRGEGNIIIVLITNINEQYMAANKKIEGLEDIIRQKDQEISDRTNIIENTNNGVIDLLSGVVESRRENNIKKTYKFKYLSFILGSQLMADHPELGLTNELVNAISEVSVLHDIGKISMPDSILYKEGRLTDEEFAIIKTHPLEGEKLIQKLKDVYTSTYYELSLDVCKYHHERWNGEGYPFGLVKDEIPVAAQIVGLVDAFDALMSKRTYRWAFTAQEAIGMIVSGQCGSFSPIIIESFQNCAGRMVNYIKDGVTSENNNINKSISLEAFKHKTLINNQTLPVIAHLAKQMPGGFFVYRNDSQGSLLFFNDMMIKYFNCASREDFMKYVNNSFKGIVHSDDFEKVINTINQQLADANNDTDHTKYRIVCKNGEEKVLEHFGHITHSDSFGEISYVFVQDVTEQERAAQSAPATTPVTTHETFASVGGVTSSRVKSLEGTRILIVDDNDLSRFMTKDTLEEEGANVSDYSSGKAALEAIKKVKPFDIILVDLVMPEMNGVDLTRAIREWEEDKDIRVPIVAVTGEISSDLAKQCLQEGANGCMSKPLIIPELARILILSMKEHSNKMERKLSSTIQKANTDVLTHVRNRTAYAEKIEQIQSILKNDPYYEFGIVGADINNLKVANDQFGHDTGDIYIKNCCKMLCDVFIHSPVYRTGGDEFSIILEGDDLINYKELMKALDETNRERSAIKEYEKGKAHIAMGVAIYDHETDMTIDDVIKRADEVMYKNKQFEKARVAGSFKY